jgi:hypothetical protein
MYTTPRIVASLDATVILAAALGTPVCTHSVCD